MMMDVGDIYRQYMYSYPHKTAYRPLGDVNLKSYLEKLGNKEDTIYFHIPFCESKCGYCNLFSVTGKTEQDFSDYIGAMERQCQQYAIAPKVSFRNLVVGGGTPLVLSIEQLDRIFYIADLCMHTDINHSYVTIETSPNQTVAEKIFFLKEKGVDRISIGVQSFWQEELDALCRIHTPHRVHQALELLKNVNFSNLNIDLIYGLTCQTKKTLQYSMEYALYYQPEEIFAYPLYIQPQTILGQKSAQRHPEMYDFYLFIRDYLQDNGYQQMSMRRFIKQKVVQEVSCGFERTLAIGCGGRSYIDDLHFASRYSRTAKGCRYILDEYVGCNDFLAAMHGYRLNQDEQKRRFVIKNLLCYSGIDPQAYQQKFRSSLVYDFPQFTYLGDKGYVELTAGVFVFTPLGMSLSDMIGQMFISDEVVGKMADWHEN